MLGWNIVPPTVLREGSRGIGSVQVFIDHDPNRHYFTFDETHIDPNNQQGKDQNPRPKSLTHT
jgi:hypothetical protein